MFELIDTWSGVGTQCLVVFLVAPALLFGIFNLLVVFLLGFAWRVHPGSVSSSSDTQPVLSCPLHHPVLVCFCDPSSSQLLMPFFAGVIGLTFPFCARKHPRIFLPSLPVRSDGDGLPV